MIARLLGRFAYSVERHHHPNHTAPSGTVPSVAFTRHFMPGYLHSVPLGQNPGSKTERGQRKNKDRERDAVDAEEPPTPALEPA